jgi:adenylate kinase family enzyme
MDIQHKQFFIIIGRSGCGKGTQAALLETYLKEQGAEKVVHTTTGGGFREFIERETYASRLSKEITNSGRLNPEFLAIWNWSNIFINTLQGNETVILDGAPRKLIEVTALESAIIFFEYSKPTVIYIDVPESWALERLKERGREDDRDPIDAQLKQKWFEENVMPVIEHYAHDPKYQYIHVNGKQSPDGVHKEVLEKLSQL